MHLHMDADADEDRGRLAAELAALSRQDLVALVLAVWPELRLCATDEGEAACMLTRGGTLYCRAIRRLRSHPEAGWVGRVLLGAVSQQEKSVVASIPLLTTYATGTERGFALALEQQQPALDAWDEVETEVAAAVAGGMELVEMHLEERNVVRDWADAARTADVLYVSLARLYGVAPPTGPPYSDYTRDTLIEAANWHDFYSLAQNDALGTILQVRPCVQAGECQPRDADAGWAGSRARGAGQVQRAAPDLHRQPARTRLLCVRRAQGPAWLPRGRQLGGDVRVAGARRDDGRPAPPVHAARPNAGMPLHASPRRPPLLPHGSGACVQLQFPRASIGFRLDLNSPDTETREHACFCISRWIQAGFSTLRMTYAPDVLTCILSLDRSAVTDVTMA